MNLISKDFMMFSGQRPQAPIDNGMRTSLGLAGREGIAGLRCTPLHRICCHDRGWSGRARRGQNYRGGRSGVADLCERYAGRVTAGGVQTSALVGRTTHGSTIRPNSP